MVGSIYFINLPYSDFKQYKARPVLVYKIIDKNDILILPLTTNLQRNGIVITNKDVEKGSLKKDSIVVIPKITAIDNSLILVDNHIATLKNSSYQKVIKSICKSLEC